jgi:rare lipoprotein A (peptidoglycan hydrolase)
VSGKSKHKPETDHHSTSKSSPRSSRNRTGSLSSRKRTCLLAVTGALTATTAIATALTAGDGGAAAGEQAAATTPPAGAASSADLLADRQAPRAGRGVARTQLPATHKPKPAAKPKRAPRPESIAAPEKRVTKPRKLRAISAGRICSASYYDEPQATASGEPFNPNGLTAAHRTLPLGSRVRVTNPDSGDSVVVRINDRGPYSGGRCLDLSRAAFDEIASLSSGVIQVRYQVL